MGFLHWFWGSVISPWALLRENNALQLANQSARYIGYKHKPYDNTYIYISSNTDIALLTYETFRR